MKIFKNKKIDHDLEEYFINGTRMRKLYNTHIHKSLFDKIIDIFVIIAISSVIIGVTLKYLIGIDSKILFIIHSFSSIVLLIFIIELYREYLRSKNFKDFFKNHWLDFIIVTMLSFYFLFISIFGIAKFFAIDLFKTFFSEMKKIRIFYKVFKK